MSKVFYSSGIDYVKGALDSKHELITRVKHLHDYNGKITKQCDPEAYLWKRKRDYQHNPPMGAELAHLKHFGEAAKRTTVLIAAYKFPETASDEQRALLDQYRRRFEAQLNGAPDPQAPLDKSGKRKYYFRFDNFIRAMIYQELKS
jgi:hypothetical protein